jgi:hypothetical protein
MNADRVEEENMNKTRACDNTTTKADSDESSIILFQPAASPGGIGYYPGSYRKAADKE